MSLSQKFISFMSGSFMILFGVLVLVWQRYNIYNSNDANAYEAILLILETALTTVGLLFHHGQKYGRWDLYLL